MIPSRPRNVVLRVAPAPAVGNLLSDYLAANRRRLDPAHAMAWLDREHPELTHGSVIPENLTAEAAGKAVGLIQARMRERRRD